MGPKFLLAIRFLFAYHFTCGQEGAKGHVFRMALAASLGNRPPSQRIAPKTWGKAKDAGGNEFRISIFEFPTYAGCEHGFDASAEAVL